MTTNQRISIKSPASRTPKPQGESPANAGLSLDDKPVMNATGPSRGTDPYNSSGSFDRTKNWERVRKR